MVERSSAIFCWINCRDSPDFVRINVDPGEPAQFLKLFWETF